MLIIGQTRVPEVFETEYEARITEEVEANWSIRPNDQVLAILGDYPKDMFSVNYGLVPFYSTSKKLIYQAPISIGEETTAVLRKSIIYAKPFRKPIRDQRCIIPCDYFIQVQNQKAYLFFHEDRTTIALAGVYDHWTNPSNSSDSVNGAAILTMPCYGLFKTLNLDYAPLMLHRHSKRWIRRKMHLNDVTAMMSPYPDKLLNGYELNIDSLELNDKRIADRKGGYFRPRSGQNYRRVRKGDSQQRTPIDNSKTWGAQ